MAHTQKSTGTPNKIQNKTQESNTEYYKNVLLLFIKQSPLTNVALPLMNNQPH